MKKRVLLIVIDALASRVIRPAVEQGRLPCLAALIQAGNVEWRSTAIFPSITPAATAALITGGYPCETGVSGAYFYDADDERIQYFGDDFWPVLREGFGKFFRDFLVRLNDKQLRIETLYESVERNGGSAACLNYLWFKGSCQHQARTPWLLRLLPGVPSSVEVRGPSILSLGDFVSSSLDASGARLEGSGGLKHRFGFDDQSTADVLLKLAAAGPLPNLTVAYFPNNDFDSHSQGPDQAVAAVQKVDCALLEIFEARGGLKRLLEDTAILVTGDHSQSDLPFDDDETGVALDKILSDYGVAPAGKEWREDDDLMACPNMRAAQIYFRPRAWPRRREIVDALLRESRVDQVIWREKDAQGVCFRVATTDRGELEFRPGDGPAATSRGKEYGAAGGDEYGAAWTWRGNLATVDGQCDREGVLHFPAYPNAFERIATAFDDRVSGDLWVTCRLGHEFCMSGISSHPRGSHGSLHEFDSLSPLIIAGGGDFCPLRKTTRSVDVAPLCRSILGLPSARLPGESHIT